MPKNIIEKIWDKHVIKKLEDHPVIFAIDLQLIHEVTSAQAFSMLREKNLLLKQPERTIATVDHSVPTSEDRKNIRDNMARRQVEQLRKNCKEFGIPIYDFGSGHQGIVHVIGPDLGLTHPGMTIVCGDSHTSTHGAFGAIAFGIGTTEVGLVMATGCILQNKPKTLRVNFKGYFKPGVFSKDAILALIRQIGVGGANGYIIEFSGETICSMSMEARMTICNMSIECGARAGIIAPDETTFEYIKGKKFAPKDEDWDKAIEEWKSLKTDEGATFDKEVDVMLDTLNPMATWGTNPSQGICINETVPDLNTISHDEQLTAKNGMEYTDLKSGDIIEGKKIQWAFVGSCTNGRIEDLKIVAKILNGKKIADHVTMYIVPGSEVVYKQAKAEGLDKIFKEAGADFRNPGCSMCIGMNGDIVPSGERCISTSNRNFVGRQGTGSITHLASPATVAASAIEGKITNPTKYF